MYNIGFQFWKTKAPQNSLRGVTELQWLLSITNAPTICTRDSSESTVGTCGLRLSCLVPTGAPMVHVTLDYDETYSLQHSCSETSKYCPDQTDRCVIRSVLGVF